MHCYMQVYGNQYNLESLRERRPPWPRQSITPTVKMLSLDGERLTPPPQKTNKQTNKKQTNLHHNLGMLPLLRCFFLANLLILEYPDPHQNLISYSLYYPRKFHPIPFITF